MLWTILVRDTVTRQVPYGSLFCRTQMPVRPQEANEDRNHRRIRICELEPVSRLAALGPIQHAARDEEAISLRGEHSTFLLSHHPRFSPEKHIHRAALDVTVVRRDSKSLALLLGELDVPNPSTDGRLRNAGTPCDLLDRRAFCTAKFAG
jgi:hypothetical protein